MILIPIINFILPLMITCLVLVDDPPRCSECRKKMRMKSNEKKTEEFIKINAIDEFYVNHLIYKKNK